MQQLTGLDGAFLAMETPTVFGHIASICVVDPDTGSGPLTLQRLTDVVSSRLDLVPPFRRRLAPVPFGLDQPYWIEDPDFDIEYHVRAIALPAPGGDDLLAEQAARLHARPLDRARPLWEMYLISGLADGRMAIYTKVHHAAIDGVSGSDILAALLDTTRQPGVPAEPAAHVAEPVPSPAALLARSALSLTQHPARAVRVSLDLVRAAPGLARGSARPRIPLLDDAIDRRRGRSATLERPQLRAPGTPWNKPITAHRRWAFCDVSLPEVKRVKQAAGVTVNDVVMALCAGALRRWLIAHDALPADPLVAAIPVSVRTDDQKGTHGNRVSAMVAALPTQEPDPLERLRLVATATRAAKEQHGALPADLLSDITQFAMPALAGQAARLAARLRLVERINPFNLIISNVPGPSVPLYYAGAEMLAYYPLSAIADGQGLNITVMSYRDNLHFGLIACRELVPDLDVMAEFLVDELATLVTALEKAG
ncbi:MAG TPA: wax ester/triacylglycerol synthase family O-acyltransferase [Mycobacteriales bacterium]